MPSKLEDFRKALGNAILFPFRTTYLTFGPQEQKAYAFATCNWLYTFIGHQYSHVNLLLAGGLAISQDTTASWKIDTFKRWNPLNYMQAAFLYAKMHINYAAYNFNQKLTVFTPSKDSSPVEKAEYYLGKTVVYGLKASIFLLTLLEVPLILNALVNAAYDGTKVLIQHHFPKSNRTSDPANELHEVTITAGNSKIGSMVHDSDAKSLSEQDTETVRNIRKNFLKRFRSKTLSNPSKSTLSQKPSEPPIPPSF